MYTAGGLSEGSDENEIFSNLVFVDILTVGNLDVDIGA
jgi:hypothetical protein